AGQTFGHLAEGRAFISQANPAWHVNLQSVGLRTLKHGRSVATGVFLVGNTEAAVYTDALAFSAGRYFTAAEVQCARPVCVLGADVARNFFPQNDAVGSRIRIDDMSFEVVGVLEKKGKFLGIENLDNTAHIPVTLMARGFTFFPGIRIVVKVGGLAQLDDAKEEVRAVMRRVRRLPPAEPDDFS